MNKQDLENLIMTEYLAELVKSRPEMKSLKTVEEIESFISQNFTREQLFEVYQKVSVSTIQDFVDLAKN